MMITLFAATLAFLVWMACYSTVVAYVWRSTGLSDWAVWSVPAALWLVVVAAGFALHDAWRMS